MLRRIAALALLLAASRALAQGSFTTEVSGAFRYDGGTVEEPLVAVSGAPSPNFQFRGDSSGRTLSLGITRWLREVPDDGATPFALLPFVARISSASLRVAQAGLSRDSSGTSRGAAVTVESSFSGDQTTTSGGLAAEWYALRETALRVSVDLARSRSTNATRNEEQPSGRGALDEYGIRSRTVEAGLGVLQRFGPELAVAVDGRFQDQWSTRTDQLLFTGEGGSRFFDYEQDGKTWGVELSGQALALGRRLSLSAGASYDSTSGNVDETAPDVYHLDEPARIDRTVRAGATYFPLRALDLSAGISYDSFTESAGLSARRDSSTGKTTALTAGARWFAGSRVSLSLTYTRVRTDDMNPPDTDTFVKLVTTTDRLELAGAVRF